MALHTLEELEERGVSYSVIGPEGYELLSAAQVVRHMNNPAAYWCEQYSCAPEELQVFEGMGAARSGAPWRIRCIARTRAGRGKQCSHMAANLYANTFAEWLVLYRHGGYCSIHGETIPVR